MALTDPKNTLSYHQSRALTLQRDMSDVPTAAVAAKVSEYQKSHDQSGMHASPEGNALWFYGMNHGVSLIASRRAPLEPMTGWEVEFVEKYYSEMTARAVRAFYYLLLICTREARHNKSLAKDSKKIAEQFGEPAAAFFKSIKGGEPGIHKALLENPPAITIGAYVEALRWQFYNSSWNGGYGGKAWGMVTDCLCRFVKGEYSAEMMLDTVWTLSHNNGPIFNKGLFYCMYSHNLIRILDIQRSGQVPQAVLFDNVVNSNYGWADEQLRQYMSDLRKEFPDQIGDYVDWEVVEALGSVQKYPGEKKAQWDEHGMSPAAKAAKEAAEAKQKAAKEAAAKKAAEHAKTWFQVMPGMEIKKVQMIRADAA